MFPKFAHLESAGLTAFITKILSRLILITLISLSLSACGSVHMEDSGRMFKRSVTVSDLAQRQQTNRRLPSLELQMEWREQAMASNHSFDPRRQPSRVPENFSQRPWGRELPLISPQVDAVFTSDFGWRRLYGRRDFHSGIDLATAAGTAIYTPVAGEVLYVKHAGTDSGIVITDGERQHTFWHTTPKAGLKRGDWLEVGYSVGRLVSWGSRTHLHYSVHLTGPSKSHRARSDGNAIDPLTLVHRLRQTVVPIGGVEVAQRLTAVTHWAVLRGAARQPRSSRIVSIPTASLVLPKQDQRIALSPEMPQELTYRTSSVLPVRH